MISLDDYNENKQVRFDAGIPLPTGIACPDCGDELYDVSPFEVIKADKDNPPRKEVACQSCGFKGYRNV